MSEQNKTTPNYYAYAENCETFRVTGSTLKIATSRFENRLIETRELHVTSVPESKGLKNEFGSIVFRIVENTFESSVDKEGNPIVGGVNSFPEPVHVVLFVTPDALALLSQRQERDRYLITIYPGTNILEWNHKEAIPIYESNILVKW